ncbi:hypothetical protein SAMN05444157_2708 [Frankineae bacterium MT45]|nr:hypothetical protein SAMN05444157_2708 [Frankineae bacterium MT45]
MPRQNRRRVDEPRSGNGSGLSAQRTESWRGEEYSVRSVTGARGEKSYRCPGCDQVVQGGVPHIVAWVSHDAEASDRRHWHTACWTARDRRAPGVQRSRSAPRF